MDNNTIDKIIKVTTDAFNSHRKDIMKTINQNNNIILELIKINNESTIITLKEIILKILQLEKELSNRISMTDYCLTSHPRKLVDELINLARDTNENENK